jgi:hypothetical protein
MGLIVGAAWLAVTWDLGGRTPVELFAERARGWAVEAGDAAKARGRALLDEAWETVADTFMRRREDAPAAAQGEERAEPDEEVPPSEPRARERVSALDRARRALPAKPAADGLPPPPDRQPSVDERRALERKLAE